MAAAKEHCWAELTDNSRVASLAELWVDQWDLMRVDSKVVWMVAQKAASRAKLKAEKWGHLSAYSTVERRVCTEAETMADRMADMWAFETVAPRADLTAV